MVSILITDDAGIKKINYQFLKKKYPTDVLAFPFNHNFLGDVVVSVETAQRNSRTFCTSTEYETLLYITHGILHLLGFADKTNIQKNLMTKKQTHILNHVYRKNRRIYS